MKVSELIDILKEMPQDVEVYRTNYFLAYNGFRRMNPVRDWVKDVTIETQVVRLDSEFIPINEEIVLID